MSENAYHTSIRLLREHHIAEALSYQRKWLGRLNDGNLNDTFESLVSDNNLLVNDFLSGREDSGRLEVRRQLEVRAYRLVDELYERMRILTNSRREFALLRQVKNDLMVLHPNPDKPEEVLYYFWLTRECSPVYEKRFAEFVSVAGKQLPVNGIILAEAAIAGVMLSILRCFSLKKFMLLFDVTRLTSSVKLRAKALVAVVMLMLKYESRWEAFPELTQMFSLLLDDEMTASLAGRVVWELVFTLHTDEANDLIDAIDKENFKPQSQIILLDDSEDQPEWLRKVSEQIFDSISTISELSEKGVDISFGHLRSARQEAFFTRHELNWFVSFDPENPFLHFSADSPTAKKILSQLEENNICDSDKYAVCIFFNKMKSLSQFTDEQWEMVAQQASEESDLTVSEREIRNAVRDLYRFFRLNPWSVPDDMYDILEDLPASGIFDLISADISLREKTADVYITTSRYAGALTFYQYLAAKEPTAQVYQRIGFAYEKLQQYDNALEAYSRADIIVLDDNWTQWRMSRCLQQLSRYAEALELIDRLIERNGEKRRYLLARAHCLEQTQRNPEAQNIYYQLILENVDDIDVMRRLSLNLMLADNIDAALDYALEVAEKEEAVKEDFLKAGWLLLFKRRMQESLEYFRRASVDSKELLGMFEADAARMPSQLINEDDVNMMREAIASEN